MKIFNDDEPTAVLSRTSSNEVFVAAEVKEKKLPKASQKNKQKLIHAIAISSGPKNGVKTPSKIPTTSFGGGTQKRFPGHIDDALVKSRASPGPGHYEEFPYVDNKPHEQPKYQRAKPQNSYKIMPKLKELKDLEGAFQIF